MRLALFLMLLSACFCFAQDRYLLVLKDGRTVAYEGTYEVSGDRVIYTSPAGERLYIKREQVDLAETKRLRNLADPQPKKSATEKLSLAEQVEAYQAEQAARQGDPNRKQLTYAPGQADPDSTAGETTQMLPGGLNLEDSSAEFKQMIGDLEGRLSKPLYIGVLVWLVLVVLASLVGFFVWIYLMVTAYSSQLGWGVGLTATFIAYLAASFFVPANLNRPVAALLYLVHQAALIAFVWTRCYGRRALLYGLLYASLVLSALGGLAFYLFING